MRAVMERIGAVAGVLIGVGTVIAVAWKTLRRLGHFLDDWFGEPERSGVPARPGMMARVERLETEVAGVKAELHPNSGHSLRDVANRIEVAVGASSARED